MRLIDYLDKGAALGDGAPCLTMGERDMSYVDVQRVTWRVARALQRAGVKPGDKVAILSSNDPVAFACVFSISRAGAVWCPINPRNEAAENRFIFTLSTARASSSIALTRRSWSKCGPT
jgi:acyl-CoA synthetase (AMP-forming)/AMP-acid ligase II